tara:strand:- start:45 stop:1031 length:987 start_codon:yes stop_codon:yes gene_type:complete
MKLLVTTGFGNIIQGGADVWTNHFIDLVLPQLTDDYFIFVDGRKPVGFETSLTNYHFHYDDNNKSEQLLKDCTEIHFLHANYHKREHLWKHKDKWGNIFVHAYLPDMLKYGDSTKQFQTNIDTEAVDDLMKYCKQRIWIGLTDSQLFTDYPNNTTTIPNFYEFKIDLLLEKLTDSKIGFTSRIESRKNVHYLDKHRGFVLSGKYDWKNIVETNQYDFNDIKFYQWDSNILDSFMKKDWSISHSCHTNEPFGYSIFQAVDYGKLPILHSDWGDIDYKYRASSKEEFDSMVEIICRDSYEEQLDNWIRLSEWMMKYDNKWEWRDKIKNLF